MRHFRWSRSLGRTLLLGMSSACWLSCGGGGELTAPTTGALEIETSTLGVERDGDGYFYAIGTARPQRIGPSTSVTLAEVAVGATRVTLSGVASNCAVDGQNPRPVTITAGGTAD